MLEKLKMWKEDLEELGKEKIKAETRLEQAMEDLNNAGYESVETAKTALKELEQSYKEAEIAAADLVESFKEKFSDYIEIED